MTEIAQLSWRYMHNSCLLLALSYLTLTPCPGPSDRHVAFVSVQCHRLSGWPAVFDQTVSMVCTHCLSFIRLLGEVIVVFFVNVFQAG